MPAEPCELTDLRRALVRFANPGVSVQTSKHIKSLHWYAACRLVIEGGFPPDWIYPRPPLIVERRGKAFLLHHDPSAANGKERVILGGLKTKKVDISVVVPGVGPVVAISLKGTHNAFRNLTNRMEEAAGDCTNLHMAYPALVYGFWHVLRANEEADDNPLSHFALDHNGRYKTADIALTPTNDLAPEIARLAHALERLSDRDDLRDHPSRYEACALTLVDVRRANIGQVHTAFPASGHILDVARMFRRLYSLYDLRFVFQAPALAGRTSRREWSSASSVLTDIICHSADFGEIEPRIAE